MELGVVGLGRMGGNMARRLLRGGHRVVGYNRDPARCRELAPEGLVPAGSLEELARSLSPPRAVWMMIPAGAPTQGTARTLLDGLLQPGDLLIDGANSHFPDSMELAGQAEERGVHFLDVGVSGGVWGLEEGYCLMAGGPEEAFRRVEPLLAALAAPGGYARVGPNGAGHFVKMIHNGIEYAMLQGYAEGFELLEQSDFELDLGQIAALWQHGSVVRSWLLGLLEGALARDARLEGIRGYVEDSGEGRWTVQYAVERAVPVPGIAQSLFARFASRQEASFAAKVIAALRQEFGGHAVRGVEGMEG